MAAGSILLFKMVTRLVFSGMEADDGGVAVSRIDLIWGVVQPARKIKLAAAKKKRDFFSILKK
jgi:hypothetical protein